jgi:hypothetical protein
MSHCSEPSAVPRKFLTYHPNQGQGRRLGTHSQSDSIVGPNSAVRQAPFLTGHASHMFKPSLYYKPLPSTKHLSRPTAQIQHPSSAPPSNHMHSRETLQAPPSTLSDRDLLPSQLLRRNGNLLPSNWSLHFTRDSTTGCLSRADSGVSCGNIHNSSSSGHAAALNRPRSDAIARDFSFESEPEIMSLAPGKAARETYSGGKMEKEKVHGPPQTFEEILRGMNKALGPTALIGHEV